MKAEDPKKIADQALQNLADALKSGKSERLTQYLAMLGRFHRYSFGNVLLILSQRPDATHVAGFSTWKQMGRYVKKGEKGIVIIAPMSIRPRDDQAEDRSEGAHPPLPRRVRLRRVADRRPGPAGALAGQRRPAAPPRRDQGCRAGAGDHA